MPENELAAHAVNGLRRWGILVTFNAARCCAGSNELTDLQAITEYNVQELAPQRKGFAHRELACSLLQRGYTMLQACTNHCTDHTRHRLQHCASRASNSDVHYHRRLHDAEFGGEGRYLLAIMVHA